MSAIWFQKVDIARLMGESVAIELSISELPRVAAAVLPESGPLDIRFGFQDAGNDIVLVDGKIHGSLKLQCQRCLDAMKVDVDSNLRLALLLKESQQELVPGDYEPLTVASGEVCVVDLIEDEILLMLPIAAKHADDECGPLNEDVKSLRGSAKPELTTPFAGLADLMRDRTD